ncbi:LysR family transcriptional regulator [Dermacoccaceae bacterium W4C1]
MTDWPDLTALELLVAVADHGSLAAGARAVGMAQPNASRSVARLQRHLGLPLLHRSTSGSTLTAEGVLVVEWSRATIEQARHLLDGAAGLVASDAGELVVSASQTIAEHLLPRWLANFHRAHPQVRTSVRVSNSDGVLADLRAGACDLGFVEGPTPPTGVHSAVISQDELVLVVAADHPWASRERPISAAELSRTPLVQREVGSGTRDAVEAAYGPCATPVLELPSNASVRLSVAGGAGPAVLSALAVADALAGGELVRVPVTRRARRELRAVWSGPRRLRGHAVEFLELTQTG